MNESDLVPPPAHRPPTRIERISAFVERKIVVLCVSGVVGMMATALLTRATYATPLSGPGIALIAAGFAHAIDDRRFFSWDVERALGIPWRGSAPRSRGMSIFKERVTGPLATTMVGFIMTDPSGRATLETYYDYSTARRRARGRTGPPNPV